MQTENWSVQPDLRSADLFVFFLKITSNQASQEDPVKGTVNRAGGDGTRSGVAANKEPVKVPGHKAQNCPYYYCFILFNRFHVQTYFMSKILGQMANFCNFGHTNNARERVNLTG